MSKLHLAELTYLGGVLVVIVIGTIRSKKLAWYGFWPCSGSLPMPVTNVTRIGRAVALLLLVWCLVTGREGQGQANGDPPSVPTPPTQAPSRPSRQVYRVHWLKTAKIQVDGRADEPDWAKAVVERHFSFPWKRGPAPRTEFRALCDEANFYFSFRVEDHDVVVLENLKDKADEVFEDRIELFLSLDDRMNDYYCIEVDSRGRALDYRASFYRKFDRSWKLQGLETKAASLADGYEIEGRIPLTSLAAVGFSQFKPGARVLCGLYRAEFSHDRSGKPVARSDSIHTLGRKLDGPPPVEDWMSWVDPHTKEPDFHVPSSLGWIEIVR